MGKIYSWISIPFILFGIFFGLNLYAEGEKTDREPTILERNGDIHTLKEHVIMKKRRNAPREQLYRCRICGQVFDEKDLRGHSNYYGHYDFENYGYG